MPSEERFLIRTPAGNKPYAREIVESSTLRRPDARLDTIRRLEMFQAHPKWEIPVRETEEQDRQRRQGKRRDKPAWSWE